jgi:hypothetical protein
MKLALLIAGSILTLGLCFFSGLMLGHIRGENAEKTQRYLEEREAVEPLLAADPTFAGVEIRARSTGGIYLSGTVATSADLERLRVKVAQALGEPRSREVITSLMVQAKTKG